jgi:hypothetical protein
LEQHQHLCIDDAVVLLLHYSVSTVERTRPIPMWWRRLR